MERAITVLSDVNALSELLDGARVDRARLVPSAGKLRLELEVTRACPELQTVERRGLMRRRRIPWVTSRLRLDQVKDAAVQRLDGLPPGQTPLLSCEAIPGGYRFVVTTADGLRLQAVLETLSGQFADTGAPSASP